MAISVAWQTVATVNSSSSGLYTVPSTGNYGTYARDLVVTNSGTATIFIGLGASGSLTSTTLASFAIPTGGSAILTQCQVPASSVVSGIVASGTGQASIGFATNVAYV